MKTTQLFFVMVLLLAGTLLKAQPKQGYYPVYKSAYAQNNSQTPCAPVYYNFFKRQLLYNGCEKISGADFLEICRGINDSAVQAQIARYDNYSLNKGKMGLVAVSAGITGFGMLLNVEQMSGSQASDQIMRGTLVTAGVIGILTIPVMAIASSVPHQRRKAVLFRDLPIAYNNYVESLTHKK